jgi:hypothetical protein
MPLSVGGFLRKSRSRRDSIGSLKDRTAEWRKADNVRLVSDRAIKGIAVIPSGSYKGRTQHPPRQFSHLCNKLVGVDFGPVVIVWAGATAPPLGVVLLEFERVKSGWAHPSRFKFYSAGAAWIRHAGR